MKTSARLERKEKQIYFQTCKIEHIVNLEADEYNHFIIDTTGEYGFIIENSKEMYIDREGVNHCILILGKDIPDGILINSEGSFYARYSGILPNAREFVRENIKTIADSIIKDCADHKDNNAHKISWDELSRRFDTPVSVSNGIGKLLCNELRSRKEIADFTISRDGIEFAYHICDNSMTLSDLIKCNLNDIHLVHTSEEHDLATITELTPDTLTAEGMHDWADVLNAKVHRIYFGYYGLHIELEGCPAERLERFSKMLAGDCSVSEYDKWVKQSATGTDYQMKM